MKTLRLTIVCGLLTGMASCGNPGQDRDSDGTDSLFSDSVARDTATWEDTTMTTDSLGSPSLP